MTVIFVILTLNNEQKISISALLSIRPVYSRPLTDGPLSVCVFLCTLRVQFFRNFTLSKYFDHVALLAFPMYTFFVLHSFSVAFSSRCTLSMFTFLVLHSFYFSLFISPFVFLSSCTFFKFHFFRVALSSSCILFILHFFHIAFFQCCTLIKLLFSCVALILCCSFFRVALFSCSFFLCSTIFMLHFLRIVLFLCCTVIHEFFFRTDFLQKSLERLPLFHVLHKVF